MSLKRFTNGDKLLSTEIVDTGGANLSNLFNYSDEEQIIGSWFGKPLYRIVINYSQSITQNTYIPLTNYVNQNHIEQIVRFEGYGKRKDRGLFYLNRAHPRSFTYQSTFYLQEINNILNITVEPSTVNDENAAKYLYGVYFIIEYTKTTD